MKVEIQDPMRVSQLMRRFPSIRFLLNEAGFASYGAPLQTLSITVQRAGSDLPFYETPTATESTDNRDERLLHEHFDIYETTDSKNCPLTRLDGRYEEPIKTVGELLGQDTDKIANLFHLSMDHWRHDNSKFSPPDAGIYPVKTHARVTVYQPPRLPDGFVTLVRNFTLLEGVDRASLTQAWDLLAKCLMTTCPAGMKVEALVEETAKDDVVRQVVQILRRAGMKR
ncbi:MAG: hypothetical protein K2W95_34090 [Candidatus Obscuribacterales bacterium]|nr:hypothetical protein [Candidatus Obscuribacterales bacterium]